jgi:hypothetical protein
VAHDDASQIEPYTHIGLKGNVASLFLGYLLMGTSSTKNLYVVHIMIRQGSSKKEENHFKYNKKKERKLHFA